MHKILIVALLAALGACSTPRRDSDPVTDPLYVQSLHADKIARDARVRRATAKVGDCIDNAYPADPTLAGQSFRLAARDLEITEGWCAGLPGCKKKRVAKDRWEPCPSGPPLTQMDYLDNNHPDEPAAPVATERKTMENKVPDAASGTKPGLKPERAPYDSTWFPSTTPPSN